MLIRYAFCVENVEQDEVFHKLESVISEERYNRMQKYHFPIDKTRSLFAEVLLRYALKKHFAMEGTEIVFETNEYGKPFLKGEKNLHFNVSHSGNWVICGISDQPVGVDVEVIKERNTDIAERFFSKKEAQAIKDSDLGNDLFYQYWTLKESYVKAEGKGMSISFNSFSFAVDGEDISLELEGKPCHTYQFGVYKIDEETWAATCSCEPVRGIFEKITISQITEMLLV
ncbi:MAG: 4'-phosphopantetheinyl transferase superfamily protein [Clostridium sp.]|nr:4'-phosphopantetheinyl transferase superfamily protein [Clostridium sp.]